MATTSLNLERALPLIDKYVEYFYRSGKFYSIARREDLDDLKQDIILHFLEKDYFGKYNPEVTSEAYFIMTGVKHWFIDTLRKQRETVYLDQPDENGITLGEKLSDPIGEKAMYEGLEMEALLEEFSDETNSKIVVIGPLGESKATQRTLVRYLLNGYTQAEIASFFLNPKSGKPVSSGRISQMVKEIRDILEVCGMAVEA